MMLTVLESINWKECITQYLYGFLNGASIGFKALISSPFVIIIIAFVLIKLLLTKYTR